VRIKGVLIDLDGTLYTNNGPIEGAREALERLDCAGIFYRYKTNTTHKPRREVAAHLKTLGLPAEEDKIFTPAIVVAEQLRAEGVSCYPLVEESLLEDLQGIPMRDDAPDYILVGNLGEGFTHGRLNKAFRHLMTCAQLIALIKNLGLTQEPSRRRGF
jgi:ribonucleotide monophosphatase NagD (HAD superfamily)